MGLTEEAGKVGTAAVGAMSSKPLAIALLLVNIGFLAFAGFILGKVAGRHRHATSPDGSDLEAGDDIHDCRQAQKQDAGGLEDLLDTMEPHGKESNILGLADAMPSIVETYEVSAKVRQQQFLATVAHESDH